LHESLKFIKKVVNEIKLKLLEKELNKIKMKNKNLEKINLLTIEKYF